METPVVCIDGALRPWSLCGKGFVSWVGDDRLHGDKQQRNEIHTIINTNAKQHFQRLFRLLLSIPENDVGQLCTFFDQNRSFVTDYRMPIPGQLRSFAPQLFEAGLFVIDQVSVELDVVNVYINDAAACAIKTRLAAAACSKQAAAACLQVDSLDSHLHLSDSRGATFAQFDAVVRQCCAFMLKPLAYAQRGVIPPPNLHRAVF